MEHADWETRATPEESATGITRRDALKRGTLLGLGLVWVTPQMSSYAMTAQAAQATSPVPETTQPGSETTEPTTGDTTVERTTPSTEAVEPEVKDTTVEPTTATTAPSGEAQPEVEDEVLSGELPFTGLPLEQLVPLAGGALATGAAVVRVTRERKEATPPVEEEQPDV